MLISVDDDARRRERAARLQARNERRRRKGKPVWESDDGWWSATEPTLAETEPAREEAPLPPPRRRLAVSTAIFGVATGLSRVLGLVREMVASYYFGAAGRINAFTVAFQVPNLVRALVADGHGAAVSWVARRPSRFARVTSRLRARPFEIPALAEE